MEQEKYKRVVEISRELDMYEINDIEKTRFYSITIMEINILLFSIVNNKHLK